MQGNSKKNLGATLAAAVIIVLVAIIIGACILLMLGEESSGVNGILGIYVAILAAIIIGVFISLVQRLREIKGGEEDEAKKY